MGRPKKSGTGQNNNSLETGHIPSVYTDGTTFPVNNDNAYQQDVKKTDIEVPQNGTLRRVEVLANLANACKNQAVLKAINALPDGPVILKIFVEAMQIKIQQVMSGQETEETYDMAENIRNNLDVVVSLSDKLQNFFIQLHQSPLVQVLGSLNKNLETKSVAQVAPQNIYQQQQPYKSDSNTTPPPGQNVSPYYESQIEQTPRHTENARNSNGPAPTHPPRESWGIPSW